MNNTVILSNNNTNEYSFKNIVLNVLSSNSTIMVNKKLVLTLGLENAWFLSFLIDQYKYYESQNKLDKDESFYATDINLSLYSTLSTKKIAKIKKEMKELKIIDYKVITNPTRTKYFINFNEIFRILNCDKSQLEIVKEKMYFEMNNLENCDINLETLSSWRKSTLKEFCKENLIKYSGEDTKEKLILKILNNKNFDNENKNENEKMIEIKEKIDSVPKTGTLKNPVFLKGGHQCSQNRNTSVPKMGTHNTYYKYITKNTSSEDDEFSTKKNLEKNKGKIKRLLNESGINLDHQLEEIIVELNISDEEILYEYLKSICFEISKNSKITHKSAYIKTCLKELNEALYTQIKKKINGKRIETQKNKERKTLDEIQTKKIEEQEDKFNELLEFLENLEEQDREEFLLKAENDYKNECGEQALESIQIFKPMSINFYLRYLSKYCYKLLNDLN